MSKPFELETLDLDIHRIAEIGGWCLDVQTGKMDWTDQVYEIFQIAKDVELSLDKFLSFLVPMSKESFKEKYQSALINKQSFREDFQFLDGNGINHWIRLIAEPVLVAEKDLIYLKGSIQKIDIEKQHNTSAQSLEEAYQMTLAEGVNLSLILKGAGVGSWIYFPHDQKLVWDSSMYDLFEIEREDFSGEYDAWEKSVYKEDEEKTTRVFVEAMKVSDKYTSSFRINTKDGKIKHIIAYGVIERDEDDPDLVTRVYGISMDQTNEVLIREDLDKQKQISEHQSKLASLGELAAGVGHEINNPLTIVQGLMEMLLRDYEKDGKFSEKKILKTLNRSLNAVSRIERIVKGLRSFARENISESSLLDLNACVRESIDLVKQIYKVEGTFIDDSSLFEDVKPRFINADQGHFQQIFMNLLSNAKDAMKGQPGDTIKISSRESGLGVCLSVTDQGTGIPQDVIDKIFDPFFTTKPNGQGTGIGLSIVNKFVNDMGGKIEVDSVEGQGTSFHLHLPVELDVKALDTKDDFDDKWEEEPVDDTIRILLAEDEQEIREIITEFFLMANMQVQCVTTGEDAFNKLETETYDLLITDIQMEKLSGVDLIAKLRGSNTKMKDIPCLIVTGGTKLDVESEYFVDKYDIAGVYYKPLNMKEFRSQVQELLQTKAN